MKVLLIVGGLVAVAAAILRFARSRVVPTHLVLASDAARVLEQVRTSSGDPTFAVFMFSTADRPRSEDALNIQFSVENGKAGFDWVLVAPRNIEDESRFLDFARQRGFEPTRLEMNQVKYLRVEAGDIAKLCSDVIREMYRTPASTKIELITEGFEWRP
jgi:hypothetical protein